MKSFVVLALLAAAVAAASLPLWDCPLCGRPPAPVNCPCCRDAGRVSWLERARRAPPDPRVLALFRGIDALGELLGSDVDVDILYSARARFAVCDGEDVVVALAHQARMSRTARQRAEAWMFSLRGELLDHVLATGPTAYGGVGFAFIGPDLALLTGPGGHDVSVWPDGGVSSTRRFRLAGGKFER